MADDRTLTDLRAGALFTHLDEDQLERLAGIAQPRRLGADETLFLQGDAADAFYLLAEGRLKVFKLLRDGRTATVRHVEPGQTFAEAALFHETYPSSTETLTECLLYRFDKEQTLALLLAEPQLAVNLLAAMAHLLGLLNRRVEELLLPVPARLARYLLARADEQLEPAAAGGEAPAGRAARHPAAGEQARARRAPRHGAGDAQPHLRPLQARPGDPHERRPPAHRDPELRAAAPAGPGVGRAPAAAVREPAGAVPRRRHARPAAPPAPATLDARQSARTANGNTRGIWKPDLTGGRWVTMALNSRLRTIGRVSGVAATTAPYVRRLATDEELRDDVTDFIRSANNLMNHVRSDRRLRRDVRHLVRVRAERRRPPARRPQAAAASCAPCASAPG